VSGIILPRRRFLQGLIAAPAVIAAERLMKLPRREIIKPLPAVIGEVAWGPPVFDIHFGLLHVAAAPVYRADGSQLQPGDLVPGQDVAMIYDGRNWRLAA
jgi:hypothetical protein